MMNHTDGWGHWAGGGMWAWTSLALVIVGLLVVLINRLSSK